MTRVLFIYLSATITLLCCFCSSQVGASNETDFDFLYFTQVWPQSACEKWMKISKNHTCNLKYGGDWSIHGIWPTTDYKIGPLYCDNATRFDPEKLKNIMTELEAHWIDVHGGHHKKYGFWKHEYLKHGSCAESIPALSTELLYFKKGLNLHGQFDISTLLKAESVYQGNSYNADTFISAVKKSLGGFSPALECEKDKDGGHFLYQVGICMTKEFKLMNCDKVAGGVYGNCPPETNSLIKYPYGPGSSGVSFGVVFVILLCLVLFGGLGYFLYTKYVSHRRLAEYNRL